MSIRTMTRVWDHAAAEGGALLALLALADFADDEGYCWPKVGEIARKARLSERETYYVLGTLEAAEELARVAGGGRGRAATYVILSGLPSEERAKRVQGLQGKSEQRVQKMQGLRAKRVQPSQGLPRETLQSTKRNPAIQRTSASPAPPVPTPQTAPGESLIRHDHDPSWESIHPSPPQPIADRDGWVDGSPAPVIYSRSVELLVKAEAKSPAAIQIAAQLPPERVQAILDEGRSLGHGIGKILLRCKAEALNPELGALIAAQPPLTENANGYRPQPVGPRRGRAVAAQPAPNHPRGSALSDAELLAALAEGEAHFRRPAGDP